MNVYMWFCIIPEFRKLTWDKFFATPSLRHSHKPTGKTQSTIWSNKEGCKQVWDWWLPLNDTAPSNETQCQREACFLCVPQAPSQAWTTRPGFGDTAETLSAHGGEKQGRWRAHVRRISSALLRAESSALMQSHRGSQSLLTSPSLGVRAHSGWLLLKIQRVVTNAWTAYRHFWAIFTPNNLYCMILECSIKSPQSAFTLLYFKLILKQGFNWNCLYFYTIQPAIRTFLRMCWSLE